MRTHRTWMVLGLTGTSLALAGVVSRGTPAADASSTCAIVQCRMWSGPDGTIQTSFSEPVPVDCDQPYEVVIVGPGGAPNVAK